MTAVLSVVHYYPPHVGGMENVAQKQAEGLVAAGFTSTVVTSACLGLPAGQRDEGGVQVFRCAANNTLDERFGLPFPLLGLGLWRTLAREVRRSDLVHLHDVFYMPAWAAFFWSLVWRKPLMLTQHVALVEHPSRAVVAIQRLVYATVGRAIFRRARQIVVYNRNVRDFLRAQGVPAAKIQELRNGIDTGLFAPRPTAERLELRRKYGLPAERLLALFVGRLVPKKGYDKLLAARSPAYDLVFVGPGQQPPSQQPPGQQSPGQPQQGSAAGGAIFLGPRTQEELAELYQACDLFVFPAVGEILTLVMQEAMASGLPVVTTDDPAYQDYDFDPHLLRFVPPEPQALRATLEMLAQQPQLRSDMADYSRKTALERFDWRANFGRLLQLYAPLLRAR